MSNGLIAASIPPDLNRPALQHRQGSVRGGVSVLLNTKLGGRDGGTGSSHPIYGTRNDFKTKKTKDLNHIDVLAYYICSLYLHKAIANSAVYCIEV